MSDDFGIGDAFTCLMWLIGIGIVLVIVLGTLLGLALTGVI